MTTQQHVAPSSAGPWLGRVARRISALELADVHDDFLGGLSDVGFDVRSTTGLEYRRFLTLRAAFPDEKITPPASVVDYWRLHARDDQRFLSDCERIVIDSAAHAADLLSQGSENGHHISHEGPIRRDVVGHSCSGTRFRERAAAFLSRLCATATAIVTPHPPVKRLAA